MKNPERSKKKVHFEPDNIDILADAGANLLEVARDAGIQIIASCGGAGTCGTCKVLIKSGRVESKASGALTREEFRLGYRLACQSRIVTDLNVYIPVESRLEKAVLVREDSPLFPPTKPFFPYW